MDINPKAEVPNFSLVTHYSLNEDFPFDQAD